MPTKRTPLTAEAWAVVNVFVSPPYICFGERMYPTRASAKREGARRVIHVRITEILKKPRKPRAKR